MAHRYVIFVIDIPKNRATKEEMQEIDSFNKSLRDSDSLIMAAGISGSADSYLVDARKEKESKAVGSFVTGGENYSGFWIIECDSDERALDLAIRASKACNRRVELRPYLR